MVHAWCVRPFIACIDAEAASPEEALALAMSQPEKLLDSAEECNRDYPWDEYGVYDEQGREVLHILDDAARVRAAAAELLAALQWLVDDLTDAEEDRNPETGEEYDSVANARTALAKVRGEP
jgi:hypothetical protein